MAVVEDGVVLAIGLLDLIEALRDQEGAHAIASEKGEARLEEIQSAERWKLVKHHEQLVPGRGIGTVLGMQMFGQPAADLVEHKTDQRLGAADVGGRRDQIERDRRLALDQIGNAPITARRDGRDGWRSEEHTSELQSLMRISYA